MMKARQESRVPSRKLQFGMAGAALGAPVAEAVAEIVQAYAVVHAPEFAGPAVRMGVQSIVTAMFVLAFGYPVHDRPNVPILEERR